MTPVYETSSPDGASAVPDELGSRGCLLVAVSYADVAGAVGPVVAGVADHILATPMLGDFVELRFADGGPRPTANEPDGHPEDGTVAERIAAELTRPAAAMDENYFALVIVDQSAAAVARIHDECRSNPSIADLPLQYRGFAAMEDRPAALADDKPAATDVIVPPDGKWTERTLAAGLYHYSEELFRHFATTYQSGITHAELAEIRDHAGLSEPIPAISAPAGHDGVLDLQPATGAPEQVTLPGLAAEAASSMPSRREASIPRSPAAPLPSAAASLSLPFPDALSGISSPPDPTSARATGDQLASAASTESAAPSATAPVAAPGSAGTAPPATRYSRIRRLASRRLRSSGAPVEQPQVHALPEAAAVPVTAIAPVFLLLHALVSPDGQVSWRKCRSLSVSLDRKLSSSRSAAFMVRAVSGADGSLRDAGHLRERDIRRPDPQLEFEQSLDRLRKAMTSDLGSLNRMTLPAIPPAVVIFAVDVPVADVISAEVYRRLAEQASVIWVVPEPSAHLISPLFSNGVQVLGFHDGIANEIAGLLQAHARIPQLPDGTRPVPEPVQQP